jgi:hypothetical protein
MPKKYVIFYKKILRLWFLFLIAIILIAAYIEYERFSRFYGAIIITIISLVVLIVLYLRSLMFTRKLLKLMKTYYRIDDKTIARKMGSPLQKIREKMFNLSQKQAKKNWLIIFINKQYFFYHQQTIDGFMELYSKGYGDKELLEKLNEFELESKAEIKLITETLIKFERLNEREVSVEERRKQERFRD